MTRFDRVEGKVAFVDEQYWKMHRIVDAKLDKLEIALDVNDNDKTYIDLHGLTLKTSMY